ncbi:hypothetical protein M2459_000831 [Parabacteroides sp. PF5-5]|uniref:glycosyl hydrolase family 28-related protein n=1 Tax=unclassified Parabacteroides TaxID=2649774 RepID=UPI0024750EE7|nr:MULTISPECIES: glycosyl hydrolase family 28-related protein [unclassified Parabacteroides]MDH6304119.1 hypothetical protein [Parabacteroides sp. PH5-39]MDH6315181.1 hypothetical protein [Parabacteroides sp. PF5-13]MDH6318826.1 hypothetical protein [Parabacteroides sp. PH5-13]MDH6322555.1 hypothetical protein [Parabacteroides sp. PH5-8]MDH6326293.1 hypothetical protein [Parabacteroides sp. PH5-41]
MTKKVFNIMFVALIFASLSIMSTFAQSAFLIATEYVPTDGKTDAIDAIQKLIDSNPNRTIVFPDGTYLVSRSILTPADPRKSVHLVLGNYAIFKAIGEWKDGGAVIRLGASNPANNISIPGSNYGIYGGIIDGSGVADGISIDGGRETRIENVSIKHTQVGVHIKTGANSGSSDADINNVNIVGNDSPTSIGVLIEGYDNTLSNMRIASVNKGVWMKSGGNSLRNIHPLYIFAKDQNYETSYGFIIESDNNWLNFCYSDQFATAFNIKKGVSVNLTDCFCFWYSGKVPFQTAIDAEGVFNSIVTGFRMGFHADCTKVTLLKAHKGGKGVLQNQIMPERKLSDEDISADYIK